MGKKFLRFIDKAISWGTFGFGAFNWLRPRVPKMIGGGFDWTDAAYFALMMVSFAWILRRQIKESWDDRFGNPISLAKNSVPLFQMPIQLDDGSVVLRSRISVTNNHRMKPLKSVKIHVCVIPVGSKSYPEASAEGYLPETNMGRQEIDLPPRIGASFGFIEVGENKRHLLIDGDIEHRELLRGIYQVQFRITADGIPTMFRRGMIGVDPDGVKSSISHSTEREMRKFERKTKKLFKDLERSEQSGGIPKMSLRRWRFWSTK